MELVSDASKVGLQSHCAPASMRAMRSLQNANKAKKTWMAAYKQSVACYFDFFKKPWSHLCRKNKFIVLQKTLNELSPDCNYTCKPTNRAEHDGRSISMNGVA